MLAEWFHNLTRQIQVEEVGWEEKREEDNQKEVFSFQIQGKKKKRGLNLSLWEPATTYASRRFPAKYFQRAEA